ncbi:MAG: asparagine synthase-related protein [Gemmatimonadota bacterium]
MKYFLALAGLDKAADEELVRRTLRKGDRRPETNQTVTRPEPDVSISVSSGEGESGVLRAGRFTVAADGALYYLDDLAHALSRAGGSAPARADRAHIEEWIACAIATWGVTASLHLEGEYAFVAWDSQQQQLIAARDHTGMWPLFYTIVGSGIAVGSGVKGLVAIPGVASTMNMVALVDDAANLDVVAPGETVFESVRRIRSGGVLSWGRRRGPREWRGRETPCFDRDSGVPLDEAAEELRSLLQRAAAERTVHGKTAVTLSGGYDSTAILGAVNSKRAESGLGPIPVVSLSHPTGDPGWEDEWIEATARRWEVAPRWIDSTSIPAIEDPRGRSSQRDEPMAHAYDIWNRVLARTCRDNGAIVMLSGVGGDAWFSGSPIFFADLLRGLHLSRFRSEWVGHLRGTGDVKSFIRSAVLPNLPRALHFAIAAMRGGRRVKPLAWSSRPGWINADFARRERLEDRQFALANARRPGESHFSAERAWFLESEMTPRIIGSLQQSVAACGVSLRMPLMDWRIIRFSATRPRWESVSGAANKHLLRASMRGLVPDEVLAPRPERTGMPSAYLLRTARAHASLLRDIMADGMLLAQHGVVSTDVLADAVATVLGARSPNPREMHQLILLAQAELWLQEAVE